MVIVAGAYSSAESSATSQVNVACPPACLLRKFQLAWANAAARIRVSAPPVMSGGLPASLESSDGIADPDRAAGDDLGAQPAAMDQAAQGAARAQPLEMRAGLGQAHAAQARRAHREFPADEMI